MFDLISATADSLRDLGHKADALNRLWRDKQLQYTWLRAAQGRHADFWQVTADALDFALESLAIPDGRLRENLLQTYLKLRLFPEVADTLQQLKSAGLKLAILSNGTPAMLRSAIEHAQLGGVFDAILSVEGAGIYKPHPRVYALAGDAFNCAPDQLIFVSSNAWDAYAASAFGMRVIWCNRYGQCPENLPGSPDFVVDSLAAIPGLVAPDS